MCICYIHLVLLLVIHSTRVLHLMSTVLLPRQEAMLRGCQFAVLLGILALGLIPANVAAFGPVSMISPCIRDGMGCKFARLASPAASNPSTFLGKGLQKQQSSSNFNMPSSSVRSSTLVTKAALEGYTSMLALDSPGAWAAFLLWATPVPVIISSLCKVAEDKSGPSSIKPLPQGSGEPALGEPGIQRNIMWAFPSFGCFLKTIDEQPPSFMPAWQKWALLINGWGGIVWYLYYKYQVHERQKVCKLQPSY